MQTKKTVRSSVKTKRKSELSWEEKALYLKRQINRKKKKKRRKKIGEAADARSRLKLVNRGVFTPGAAVKDRKE
jgi:hypothetical protein